MRVKISSSEFGGVKDTVWEDLKSFEGSWTPSQRPKPNRVVSIPENFLTAFGKAIIYHRQLAMERASEMGLDSVFAETQYQPPLLQQMVLKQIFPLRL